MRLFGKSINFEYVGSIHNNISKSFYEDWKENNSIGILYNPENK